MSGYRHVRLSGDLSGEYVVLESRTRGVLRIAPEPPKGLPRVTQLKQTSAACPAQWEGTLDDGRALYVRYRGGQLSVGAGEDIDDAVKNRWGEKALLQEQVGDGLDGYMDFEQLRAHLYGLLDFDAGLEAEEERKPRFDPEEFAEILAATREAKPGKAKGGDEEEGDEATKERVGTGLAVAEIRAWTCFSCGAPLTQAHAGDYSHTEEGSGCADIIPVPTSLARRDLNDGARTAPEG